jgi:Protein of unknown function (DUF416)
MAAEGLRVVVRMSDGLMARYDEVEIKARLAPLDKSQKTAFAAACAERLWSLFERYSEATGRGDVAALRVVLDSAWRAARGEQVVGLDGAQGVAEGMVPSDDGEWVFEMRYGQNSTAAVAYAVRTWLTDDPQEGAWGARQVYEAADYAAQRSLPDLDLNGPDAEQRLLASRAVQDALAGMSTDLMTVESHTGDRWERLQQRARQEGEAWARTLP